LFFDNTKVITTIDPSNERTGKTVMFFMFVFLVKLQKVYVRMTRLGEAMKDGVSTEMFRGAANML
jgi:hypothetical protein